MKTIRRHQAKYAYVWIAGGLLSSLLLGQGCSSSDDDDAKPTLTGGTAGTGGTGGSAGSGGAAGSGATDGGGTGGTGDAGSCNPKTGADGCFNCPANTNEFMNQCHGASVQCSKFPNTQARLPKLNANGTLPPLP
jgi:hypothetical protein